MDRAGRLIFLFLITFLSGKSVLLQAQARSVFQPVSLDNALVEARSSNLPVFIYVFTDNCTSCNMMDQYVFSLPEAENIFNRKLVNLRINEEEWNSIMPKNDQLKPPFYIIMNWDRFVLWKASGFKNLEEWKPIVDKVSNSDFQLNTYAEAFKTGRNDPNFLFQFLRLNENRSSAECGRIAEKILGNPGVWSTAEGRYVIFHYMGDLYSPEFRFFAKNKPMFIEQFGEQAVSNAIKQRVDEVLPYTNDLSVRDTVYAIVYPQDARMRSLEYRMEMYERYSDFEAYSTNAIKFYRDYHPGDTLSIKNDLARFVKHAPDDMLEQVAEWTNNLILRELNAGNLMLRARLFQRMGKLEAAEADAKHALKLEAKKKGNTYPIKQFIKSLKA